MHFLSGLLATELSSFFSLWRMVISIKVQYHHLMLFWSVCVGIYAHISTAFVGSGCDVEQEGPARNLRSH